jgi:acetyl-CoA C-acetyltransferase
MSDAYIISGCRTPIGKFLGALSGIPATALGAIAVQEAVRRAGVAPEAVDEVIMGNILSAGLGQAPARQAAIRAGIPPQAGAVTINKMCGSGLKAVMLAAQAIQCGDVEVVVAGGLESMSRSPYLLPRVRKGWKYGHEEALDSMIHDGLWCAFDDKAMGAQADYIADKHGVSREDQDRFALESHRRAVAARDSGAFDEEIIPVEVKAGQEFANDEGPRADTTLEKLAGLKPAFDADGTVTAGNASMLSDGAAALVVTSAERAEKMDSPIRARIVAYATSGVEPREIFIAPVSAVENVLAKAGLEKDDIDLYETNEAFAAQMLACTRSLDLDSKKVNVHGGAVALGHPIGASGARVLVTLLYALKQRNLRRGLASLCLGGGNAVAMIVERE